MKKLFSMIISILIIISAVPIALASGDMVSAKPIDGFELKLKNSRFELWYSDQHGAISIVDKEQNSIWYSTPKDVMLNDGMGLSWLYQNSQILINYMDHITNIYKVSSFGECFKKNTQTATLQGNIFKITFLFEREDISIPVYYSLDNNGLKVSVKMNEIKEMTDNRLISFELLPYFGAASLKDNGYFVIPDGCGAIINFNNDRKSYKCYSGIVHGKNRSVFEPNNKYELPEIKMPVFGAVNNSDGFLAIISQSETSSKINAQVSTPDNEYNNIYASKNYRYYQSMKDFGGMIDANISSKFPDKSTFTVEYRFLTKENASYSGMAEYYRQYLSNNHKLKKKENSDNYLFIDFYGAVKRRKSFFGIPYMAIEEVTSFKQAENIIKEISSYASENIISRFYMWNNEQLTGKIQSQINPVSKIGGIKGLKSLNEFVETGNNKIFYEIGSCKFKSGNLLANSFWGNAKNVSLGSVKMYSYGIATRIQDKTVKPNFLIAPIKLDKVLSSLFKDVRNLGINTSFTELGSFIYSDFSDNKYGNNAKQIIQNKIGQEKSTIFSNCNSNLYRYASYITDIPVTSSKHALFNQDIPFVQMVLGEYIEYSAPSFNETDDPSYYLLKLIETGSALKFTLTNQSNKKFAGTDLNFLINSQYSIHKDKIKLIYNQLAEIRKTTGSIITSYIKIDYGVYKTVYDNNSYTIVNYTDKPYIYKENTVGPNGYIVAKDDNFK